MPVSSTHFSIAPSPNSSRGKALCWIDNRRGIILVKAPFSHDFNNRNRSLDGRAWNQTEKTWEFSLSARDELIKVLWSCFEEVECPPLEIFDFWSKLSKDDIKCIARIVIKSLDGELREKSIKFFKNYIEIDEVIKNKGRMLRIEPQIDEESEDDLI